MGFERWVDYALDVPMYFVKRGDNYIDVAGQSFRDLLAGKLAGAAGRARDHLRLGEPHLDDLSGGAAQALSRNARRRRRSVAAAAGAAGLLGRHPLRRRLRSTPPGTWSRTGPPRSARSCATRCRGSASRRRSAAAACSTLRTRYAAPGRSAGSPAAAASMPPVTTRPAICARSRNIVARGITPAEELLEKFHGPWGGSVDAGLQGVRVLTLASVRSAGLLKRMR